MKKIYTFFLIFLINIIYLKQLIAKEKIENKNINNKTVEVATKSVENTVKVETATKSVQNTVKVETTTKSVQNTEKKPLKPSSEDYYKDFLPFMINKNNLNTIKKAMNRYDKALGVKNKTEVVNVNLKEEDTEEGMEENNSEIDKNIGNVYLKSILYISKNNWVVWINDKKITSQDNKNEDNEFLIDKINNDKIDIIWGILKSKWKFININDKITSDKYTINEETNKIEIKLSLHPNQTFVASENVVIDGKYKENIFLIEKEVESEQSLEENINFDDLLKDL